MATALLTSAVRLTESLMWMSRKRAVDGLIVKLAIAYEHRFARQERYFLRKGLPELRSAWDELREASEKKIPKGTTEALAKLDVFNDPLSSRIFLETVKQAVLNGADQGARDLSIGLSFNAKSDRVLDYLKEHTAEKLGADVDAVTKKRLQNLIVKGYEERWTFTQLKREIRGLYSGFHTRSAQKFISDRAEAIAVTEIGQAYSAGSLMQAEQLASAGVSVEKAWALAAHPCPICEPNGAQGWIPLNQNFSSGHARPLAHPVCRCSLLVRTKPQ